MDNRERLLAQKVLEIEEWANATHLLQHGEEIVVRITILNEIEIPENFWTHMEDFFGDDHPQSSCCRAVLQKLKNKKNQPTLYSELTNWFSDLEIINSVLQHQDSPYRLVDVGESKYKVMRVVK